jgi:hypothetical protein
MNYFAFRSHDGRASSQPCEPSRSYSEFDRIPARSPSARRRRFKWRSSSSYFSAFERELMTQSQRVAAVKWKNAVKEVLSRCQLEDRSVRKSSKRGDTKEIRIQPGSVVRMSILRKFGRNVVRVNGRPR